MTPCELTATVTAVANFLACNFSSDELEVIGAIFIQIGDTLETIVAQKSLCQTLEEKCKQDH